MEAVLDAGGILVAEVDGFDEFGHVFFEYSLVMEVQQGCIGGAMFDAVCCQRSISHICKHRAIDGLIRVDPSPSNI